MGSLLSPSCVYKAKRTGVSENVFALKKIQLFKEKDGVESAYLQFPVTALREIKILQTLRHENILRLYRIINSKSRE